MWIVLISVPRKMGCNYLYEQFEWHIPTLHYFFECITSAVDDFKDYSEIVLLIEMC